MGPWTASTMTVRISAAVWLDMTLCPPDGEVPVSTVGFGPFAGSAAWARTALTTYGSGRTPPFATVAATRAIWNGVTATCACPKAAEASSTWSANGEQPPPEEGFETYDAETGRVRPSEPMARPEQNPKRLA